MIVLLLAKSSLSSCVSALILSLKERLVNFQLVGVAWYGIGTTQGTQDAQLVLLM